jgi:hypothetical protein
MAARAHRIGEMAAVLLINDLLGRAGEGRTLVDEELALVAIKRGAAKLGLGLAVNDRYPSP